MKNLFTFNKLSSQKINIINNIIKKYKFLLKYEYNNMTDLHRWCIITSPKYKNTCNWKKKLDNAGKDNCFTNFKK